MFHGLSSIQKTVRILKFANDLFRIVTFPFRHNQVSLPEGQMRNSHYTWTSLRGAHHGPAVFQRNKDAEERRTQERIAYLENRIQRKDEVLAELMLEHVALKKSLGEP